MNGPMRTAARVALCAALGLATPAAAQTPPPRVAQVMPSPVPARVEMQVQVIRASKDGTRMDPKLAAMAATLQRTPFTDFALVDERRFRLTDGASQMFGVLGGHEVTLTLTAHQPTEAKVRITLQRKGVEPIEADLTIKRDRAFMYVIQTDDKRTSLLLKVDVRY